MEFVNLQTFITVVEKGGITRAAEKLNRVPSGITTRIHQLEESLGTPLFLREGKRMLLTPKGHVLFDYAKRIVDLVQEAQTQIQGISPGGQFRIGAMESTASVRLARPLTIYHRKYPQVALQLSTGTSGQLLEQLLSNELDAVFVIDTPADERLERANTFAEELVFIVSKAEPLMDSPVGIRNQTLLAFKVGCSYRQRAETWYRNNGGMPDHIVDMASYHAILGGVAAGMGVALVPKAVLASFSGRSEFVTYELPHQEGVAVTELLWRKGVLSANLAAFTSVLAQQNILK